MKILIFIFAVLVLNACAQSFSCAHKEIRRVSSPDKKVDAVITKSNCGATATYSYKISIVPKGKKAQDNYVYLSDKTEDLEVSWLASKKLVISYGKARIFEYKNFWQSDEVNNYNYIVEITEMESPAKRARNSNSEKR